MDTLEALGRRIHTTQELKSIVHTMKTLSAVSIRHYEDAVASLREYSRTVELGLRVVLGYRAAAARPTAAAPGPVAFVVFGSDHGLCGRFNEQIVAFARAQLREEDEAYEVLWLTAGERAGDKLEAAGETPAARLQLPGAPSGLVATAETILLHLDRWRAEAGAERILVAHNCRGEQTAATPRLRRLLPPDPAWLQAIATEPWPTRRLPTYSMDADELLAALVREYLFIGVYQAAAESIASEHAARLAAMQEAEHNIDESLDELGATYRRLRQELITEELLDVVAGFEVLQSAPQRR